MSALVYDPATGKASMQTVTATSLHHDDNLVDVTLRVSGPAANSATTASAAHATKTSTHTALATGTAATPSSSTHDEVVHTTTTHPWLTADHGWMPASFLHLGEPVVRADGTTATVVVIRAVPGAAAMWDLTVSNVHTFAVGAGQFVVHNCGNDIPWSSRSVAKAAKDLDEGAREVHVSSRSEAEELFLGKYQGEGYRNTTGFQGPKEGFWDEFKNVFGRKEGTYHWDEGMGEDGRLSGHDPVTNPHGAMPHLQIHTFGGDIVRIFFPR